MRILYNCLIQLAVNQYGTSPVLLGRQKLEINSHGFGSPDRCHQPNERRLVAFAEVVVVATATLMGNPDTFGGGNRSRSSSEGGTNTEHFTSSIRSITDQAANSTFETTLTKRKTNDFQKMSQWYA